MIQDFEKRSALDLAGEIVLPIAAPPFIILTALVHSAT